MNPLKALFISEMLTEESIESSVEIVSFQSAGNQDISSLVVDLNPIQDLHGYDNPWPAGGGKNKFSDVWSDYNRPYDYRVCPVTLTEGTWCLTASIKGSAVSGCAVGIAKSGDRYATFDTLKLVLTTSGSATSISFTVDSSWTDPKLCIYCSNEDAFNSIFENYSIQLELGSSATPYAPYSNICPISGYTGVDAYVDGKNLLSDIKNDWSFIGGSYGYIGGVVPKAQTAIMSFTDKDTSVDISDISIGFVYDNTSICQLATKFRWTMQAGTVKSDTTNVAQNDSTTLCQNVMIYPRSQEAWDRLFARYNIQVELGTTSSAYNPYVTTKYQVTFPAVGVNQWDEEWELGLISSTTGANTSGTSNIRCKNYMPVFPSTEYKSTSPSLLNLRYYDIEKTFLAEHNTTVAAGGTFTIPSNAYFMRFFVASGYGTTYKNDISINYPSSVTTYEPYTTTVYSGYLDLVSGELVLNDAKKLFDGNLSDSEFSVTALSGYTQIAWANYANIGIANPTFVCDTLKFVSPSQAGAYTIYSSATAARMFLGLPSTVTTKAEAKAWFASNPTSVIYPLATPITFRLTPQQIQTLVGTNNIWSDSGNVNVIDGSSVDFLHLYLLTKGVKL